MSQERCREKGKKEAKKREKLTYSFLWGTFNNFLNLKKIYLFIREKVGERGHKQEKQQTDGEAGSQVSRKPSVGSDLRTLG